jgi:hypothetical protein
MQGAAIRRPRAPLVAALVQHAGVGTMRLVVHGRRGQKKTIGNIAGVIEIEIIEIKGDEVMLAMTTRGPDAVVPKEERSHVSGEAQTLVLKRDDLPLSHVKLINAIAHKNNCFTAIEDHARAVYKAHRNSTPCCGCSSDTLGIIKKPACDVAVVLVDEYQIAAARTEELRAATTT